MALPAAVFPHLYPVRSEEIAVMNAEISFPTELVDCWLEIGCGFFSKNEAGERLTNFQNHLLGPDEILEMKDGGAFPEDNPFDMGMPFFETADMRFLIIRRTDQLFINPASISVIHSHRSFMTSS